MLRNGLFCVLTALVLASTSAARQEPKLGSGWYEDKVDLGFKVRAPKDWEFVPSSPLEPNMIGKYSAPNGQFVNLGGEAFVLVTLYLVKFDGRAKDAADKEKRQVGGQTVEFSVSAAPDVDAWMSSGIDEGQGWHPVERAKPLKGAPASATVAIYEGLSARGRPEAPPQAIRAHVTEFQIGPDVRIALVGLGPGEKKWRPYEKAYESIAKTLQVLDVAHAAGDPAAATDARSVKRVKLQETVAKNPGWSLYETPNYFLLSSYDDKQFIEELKTRLEAIRAVYEQDYPPSNARKIRVDPPKPDGKEAGGEATASAGSDQKTVEAEYIDPLELSRTSVVRLCKDRNQYLQYGGPQGTGGYFNWVDEELVIYDDKQSMGRDLTWGVLNHEAFHQYIFYFYGNIAPHSWYNEGTGDYYFGFEYKNGKFKLNPSRMRQAALVSLIGQDRYAPLKDFVRWSKAWYYGNGNPGNGKGGGMLSVGDCYAQGWSLIWFLRTGAGKAKGWQKSWDGILDKYLAALVELGGNTLTTEAEEAEEGEDGKEGEDAATKAKKMYDAVIDKAFEGVDWDAFEASWLSYTR